MATESALRISSSSSVDDGSLENKLSIDLVEMALLVDWPPEMILNS